MTFIRLLIPFCLLALASMFVACAAPSEDPLARGQTTCGAGTAIIALYDGSLQRLCGCGEGRSAVTVAGTNLVCTVPLNTAVTFYFMGTRQPHQIMSTGSPTFVSSPYADPSSSSPITTHAVKLTAAGSYNYHDVSEPALTGTIVVTP